jgi:hypothetical protein
MGDEDGKKGILTLLDIMHFGRSEDINICVNLLLSCVHRGFLWLDRLVSIDTELIARIIGFLSKGKDPSPLFTDKTKEKALAERMKEKYDTFIGARSLDVVSIKYDTVWFVITQTVGWEKPDPIHKMEKTVGYFTHCHLS